MRKLSANHAFIVMLCANALTFAVWASDLQYLKTHRPAVADAAHGFVLRQETRHPDGVFYESAQDRAVYWGMLGLDLGVFIVSVGVAYIYARKREARERERRSRKA